MRVCERLIWHDRSLFFSLDSVPAVVSASVDNLAFCCRIVDAVTQRLVLTGDAAADISQLFFFFSSSSIVFLSPLGQNERRGGRPERLCVKCHGCCNDKVTADFTGKCHRGSVSPTLDSLCEDTRTNQRVTSICIPPLLPQNRPCPTIPPQLPALSPVFQTVTSAFTVLYHHFFPTLYYPLRPPEPPPRILGPTVPLHISAIRIKNVLHNVIGLQNLRQL